MEAKLEAKVEVKLEIENPIVKCEPEIEEGEVTESNEEDSRPSICLKGRSTGSSGGAMARRSQTLFSAAVAGLHRQRSRSGQASATPRKYRRIAVDRRRAANRPASPESWSPSRSPSLPRSKEETSSMGTREVWVGNLPGDITAEAVTKEFEALFARIPQFSTKYSHLTSPVSQVQARECPEHKSSTFAFVQFEDDVLAATALSMTGVQIRGRSTRISLSPKSRASEGKAYGLDVSDLRTDGTLPWTFTPGGVMLNEVFVGGITGRHQDVPGYLAQQVTSFLCSMPAVIARFPEMTKPVLRVKYGRDFSYGFIELANELLASTLVSLRSMQFLNCCLRFGWPSDCKNPIERAPPSLCTTVIVDKTKEVQNEGKEDDKGEEDTNETPIGQGECCMVYVGGVRGIETGVLFATLTKSLKMLPAYHVAYPDKDFLPVRDLRVGKGCFAFAYMADPVLASTAVALGTIWVGSRQVTLKRPARYDAKLQPQARPLELSCHPADLSSVKQHHTDLGSAKPRVPPPPPPPPVRNATLRISNLPNATAYELEQHLLEVAMMHPEADFENGPPLERLWRHRMSTCAFARMKNQEIAQKLIPLYKSTPFQTHNLVVDFANCSERCTDIEHVNQEIPEKTSKDPGEVNADKKASDDVHADTVAMTS